MPTASLRFGNVLPEVFESTDAEFLAALKWRDHETQLRPDADTEGDLKTVGLAWKQQCLEHRAHKVQSRFATLDRVLANDQDALPMELLALRENKPRARSKKKAAKADSPLTREAQAEQEQTLRHWLATGRLTDDAIVLLGCLELLLFRADQLAAQTVGELWRWTLSAALRLSEQLIEIEEGDETEQMLDSEVVLRVAIASGLLPWLCGLFFDDVKGAPKLAKSGRKSLTSLFISGTDDGGAPTASVVRGLGDWLALWTDTLIAGRRFKQPLWKDSQERRFVGFLKTTTALAMEAEPSPNCELLGTLAELIESKPDDSWRTGLNAVLHGIKHETDDAPKKKDIAGWQSDTCSIACLRTSWRPDASRISVLHDRRTLTIDMTINGRPFAVGDWGLQVMNNGERLELTSDWECCCWYTDKEVDYAEWTATANGCVKVGRYALLHREAEYAVLADVIKNASPVRIDVTSTLPLINAWTGSGLPGTREQAFLHGKHAVRAFPLMLPQDVGLGTSGNITHRPGEFSLTTAATGGGLFSPLVLDWNSKRLKTEAEWRELTITEAGQVDHTSGRGFRIALGKHNLLLMRGLRSITRYRTVLGYQTWNETVVASLNKDGIFDEILLVEQ